MEKGRYWTIGELAQALAGSEEVAGGKMSLAAVGTEGVLQLTLHEHGDLAVVVGVEGLEIQASVALVPVAEIRDSASFDRKLLQANKLLPLSTFGITEIAGTAYYEIFGQLSGGSELEEVIEEIDTLGRNALEAAQMIQQWQSSKAA
jgi:uncharacterized protein YjfI (DUF2170 family)